MKSISFLLLGCLILTSCNDATDGDANTDTTNLVTDSNRYANPGDSSDHVNSAAGTLIDSAVIDKKGGEGASKKTPASSRVTTPNNSVRLDTLKQ